MKSAVALCVVLVAAASVRAFENCSGSTNTIPVHRDEPVFVRAVTNGKRYLGGQGNDTFHVVHLYGSHYDMGFAHGQLMGEYFPIIDTIFNEFLENELEKVVKLPDWLAEIIAEYGASYALKLTIDWTKPFTPQKYLDELQGMADGSGYDFETIYKLNLVPELIRAACTIVGATGGSTSNGQIAHLRGLDFAMAIPVRDWPQVTVLHGNGTENVVVNFGWTMLTGALTGISSKPIGIGEKVWIDNTIWLDGVHGQPWMYILRDVLYTNTLEEAISTMQNANRTCAIHVGVGDGNANKFRGITMAKRAFDVYNWSSLEWEGHPIIKDVFYWDKHEQPSHDPCLGSLLQHFYGNITAELLALTIAPTLATGDYHSVAFDYAGGTAYFANARKDNITEGETVAYWRQYTWLNVTKLIQETL